MQSGGEDDIVIVETKDYAQVVFDDVKECYTEKQSIECTYILNKLLRVDTSDSIGIYRVGFANCNNFVCSLPVDLTLIADYKGKLVFDANLVPADDGDFYQFVYVSQGKYIRGASIPFQFKRCHLSDYIEVEESETVLIKSKETAYNETLTEIKSRCENLSQANDTYEQLIKENDELIKVLKNEVTSTKVKCIRLSIENEKLTSNLRSKSEALNDTTTMLSNEKQRFQAKLNDLIKENLNLHESLQRKIDQLEQLKTESDAIRNARSHIKELYYMVSSISMPNYERPSGEVRMNDSDYDSLNLKDICSNIESLEKEIVSKIEELKKVKQELKRNEELANQQNETIQSILEERDSLNSLINKLTSEKNDLESDQVNLSQELNMSKDKLAAAEQCKEMLRSQLHSVTMELNETNAQVESYLNTIKQLSIKENHFDLEKNALFQQMQQLKDDYEAKLDAANGRYFSLHKANSSLESRFIKSEHIKEKYEKESFEKAEMLENYKRENEELKDRLRVGAKEYAKLLEKYRYAKQQQFISDLNDFNYDSRQRDAYKFLNQQFRHSMPSEDADSYILTAIQNSKSEDFGRSATTAVIENNLLDSIIKSYKQNSCEQERLESALFKLLPSRSSATTQQPKLFSSQATSNVSVNDARLARDFSDDGLINILNTNSNNNSLNHSKMFKSYDANEAISFNGCQPKFYVKELLPVVNTVANYINTNSSFSAAKAANPIKNEDNYFDEQFKMLKFEKKTNLINTLEPSQLSFDISKIRTDLCDICKYVFPTDSCQDEIKKHYVSHYGPTCSICSLRFRKDYPQADFESHVQSHFSG